MLWKLRDLLLYGGSRFNVTGSRGGGGSDDNDPKDKNDKNDEPDDPFANFDFNRFRSSRSSAGRNPDDDGIGGRGPFNFNFGPGGSGGGGGAGQVQLSLPKPSRRLIISVIVIVILALLVFALPSLTGFWTDAIWFNEVGQSDVFWISIWARVLPFIGGAVLAFIVIFANILVARRIGPRGPLINTSDNPIAAIVGGSVRALNLVFVLAAIIVSLILGGSLSGSWQTILNYINAAPWNDVETIFNQSAGYYVFQLPFFSLIQGWLAGLLVVSAIAAALVYALNFALSGARFNLTTPIKSHLSLLGALLLGLFAWGYQISNSQLVYSPRGVVPGASATDIEAQVPANNILTVIIALAAILLLVNIFIRNERLGTRLLIGAAATWIIATLLIGNIFPGVYQSFTVKPNEITKESPYIKNTITQTRKAFGIDKVQASSVAAVAPLTSNEVVQNPLISENVRLWDYDKVQQVYDQREALRRYYNFTDVDIDRYNLNLNTTGNKLTQVMISARELEPRSLDTRAQNWQSQHLQYTHGYGFQASPVNQVDRDGRPVNLITQSFPLTSTGVLRVDQPRIYYGTTFDNRTGYVLVDTKLQEIDYPFTEAGQGSGDSLYSYTGKGGVKLDNFFVKAAFAIKLGDFNLLISDALNNDSKLLFRRNLIDRVRLIAPFLRYDTDPYLVVANGRMYWMLDAYTTTNLYPHADYNNRQTQDFNYIRNSVKIVTDAYDGTINFYISDATDPLVNTYAKTYPSLFKPLSAMPVELRSHIRYPELFFNVQTQMYLTYHVDDPVVYYNRTDQWEKPLDPRSNQGQALAPYYLVTELPGQSTSEFVLIQLFKPQGTTRLNLVSWMAARSDGDNYGKLVVYNYPSAININGPQQFFSLVNADQTFSQERTFVTNSGSTLQPGPLLIVPVENSLLYVLPYYLVSSQNPIPTLYRVAVGTTDNRIAVRNNLETALTDVFRSGPIATPPNNTGTPPANTTPLPGTSPQPTGLPAAVPTPTLGGSPVPSGATVADLIRSSQEKLARAEAARARGDLATYQSEYQSAQQDLARLSQLLGVK